MPNNRPWKEVLKDWLPLLGHRNWIVVADAAYPWQTAAGIETIFAADEMLEVVDHVLKAISAGSHVRPAVYLDAELPHVSEQHAPGVTQYREGLVRVLQEETVESRPHEQIIAQLDKAGKAFRILLIKTPLTIPYSSIFIQLECGYWSEEAETDLRNELPSEREMNPDETP